MHNYSMILLHRPFINGKKTWRHCCSNNSIDESNTDGRSRLDGLSLIRANPTPSPLSKMEKICCWSWASFPRNPQTSSPQRQMTCPLSPLWSAQRSQPARRVPTQHLKELPPPSPHHLTRGLLKSTLGRGLLPPVIRSGMTATSPDFAKSLFS